MQQHGSGNRGIEPTQVQYRFRFARTHEMPPSVNKHLDPGVVVVRVRPARRVDLPCRYPRRTQCRHGQHGLLPAAAVSRADGRQRRRCPRVRRSVGRPLVAPMVYLQRCLGHGHSLYPLAQRIRIYQPEIIQRLVIHPEREHKMPELPLRHVPIHSAAHVQRLLDVVLPPLLSVHHPVRQRHARIKEIHVLLFPGTAGNQQHHCRHQFNLSKVIDT